jgi:hypothetical protein
MWWDMVMWTTTRGNKGQVFRSWLKWSDVTGNVDSLKGQRGQFCQQGGGAPSVSITTVMFHKLRESHTSRTHRRVAHAKNNRIGTVMWANVRRNSEPNLAPSRYPWKCSPSKPPFKSNVPLSETPKSNQTQLEILRVRNRALSSVLSTYLMYPSGRHSIKDSLNVVLGIS